MLVSRDGVAWELPAGRPEDDETWRETLVREVSEEACASVTDADLLGFVRSTCVEGRQAGLVLVRSMWRAEVRLEHWAPAHEMSDRRLVGAGDLEEHLLLRLDPLAPFVRRLLLEAGVC